MNDWITELYESNPGWQLTRTLVDIPHRVGGTETEAEAARLVRDAFSDAGVRNARLDEFELPSGWKQLSSSITGPTGRTFDCFAWIYSPSTAVSGSLVDVGYGTAEELDAAAVEGNVALFKPGTETSQARFWREKYSALVEAGAVGTICRNSRPGNLPISGCISDETGGIGPIPAVGTSKEVGDRLCRLYEGETVHVEVGAELFEASCHNVVGELGPETEQMVVVGGHLDSHDIGEGAMDDVVGIGAVVNVARALALREEELETKVQFVGFGAEQLGFLGSGHHAATSDRERIKCVVQNDGIARDPDLRFYTNGWDELASVCRAVCDRYERPSSTSDVLHMGSDHWRFVEWGVPGVCVGSVPDATAGHRTGFKDDGQQKYMLTPGDTLDKLDPRILFDHSAVLTQAVVELSKESVQIPHASRDDVLSRARERGNERPLELYENIRRTRL